MRSLLLSFLIVTFAFTARTQSIQLTVTCTDGGLATSPYTLNAVSTTTDAGKTRNTFISNALLPPQTFGETMIIRWNLTTHR